MYTRLYIIFDIFSTNLSDIYIYIHTTHIILTCVTRCRDRYTHIALTYSHIYIYIYIHTYIHTYIYICTSITWYLHLPAQAAVCLEASTRPLNSQRTSRKSRITRSTWDSAPLGRAKRCDSKGGKKWCEMTRITSWLVVTGKIWMIFPYIGNIIIDAHCFVWLVVTGIWKS